MANYKYLIVGQGLAGTICSYQLMKHGIKHKVLDNGHRTAATKAAAGIINPITGRRYVKSWMIDDLLPVAKETYAALELWLGISLVMETSIIRSWDNITQENQWNEATSRPGYAPYVASQADSDAYKNVTNAPYGCGEILQAMQVNVSLLISAYRDYLQEKCLLLKQEFDHLDPRYKTSNFKFGDDNFESIVFCEGYKVLDNPLFNTLPFQPVKGESLIVKSETPLPKKMIRDKIFIAPKTTDTFWTGGGYEWDDLSETPTEAFKTRWKTKLDDLLLKGYKVQEHRAGVRPSVKGRRPVMGRHQVYSHIYLFNGMGTKGTSLAPYWAEHFVGFMEGKNSLSKDVDFGRFNN